MEVVGVIFGIAGSVMALLAFGLAGTAMSKASGLEKSLEELRKEVKGRR
jgi:hypothetical protein